MPALRTLLLSSLALGAIVFWCCSLGGEERAELVIGNGPDPMSLDPAQCQSVADGRLMAALFSGLVTLDPEGGPPQQGMARQWTVSEDGKRWSFNLRPELRWSDGTALNAPDLVWSYLRFLQPSTGARMADLLDCVVGAADHRRGLAPASAVGITASSAHEIVFQLREIHPCFLTLLAQFPLFPVPRHVIERHGSAWTRTENFVSNGSMRLVSRRLRDSIRLEPNPHWLSKTPNGLQSLEFRCVDNPATLLNLYVAGEVDIAMDVPMAAMPTLLASPHEAPGSELRRHTRLGTYFLRLNVRHPSFENAAVRSALALAVDRVALTTRLLRGGEAPAWNFTPPGIHCGTLLHQAPLPQHATLVAAQKLLQTGLASQGLRELPPFELLHTTDPLDAAVSEWLQQRWQEIGVTCRAVALDARTLRTRMAAGDYAAARSTWMADYDDASNFLECFESTSAANRTGWANSAYDALLREARTLVGDDAARSAKLREAETMLLSTGPVVPLFHHASRTLVKPWVRGFTPNPLEWVNPAALWVQR